MVLAGRKGAEQEAGAADVEGGVAVGDGVGEGAAGRRGRDGEIGDGDDDLEVFWFEAHGAHADGGEGPDHEPAEEGGGGVVGVAVELADDVEQVGGGDLTPEQVVGGDGPADERGRAPAQASRRRDEVLLHETEVGVRLADELGDKARRPVGRMLGPARDQIGTRTAYLYLRMSRPVQPDPHAQREREPNRIVAWSEVCGGGRDADGDHLAGLSMNSATASNVAGTGSGSCTRPRITSGSLSPCPVRTLTTVPSGPLPSPASFMRPAMPAAEAGSQKTPSSWASISWAARISASVTLSMRPPDSRAAERAPSLLAGEPILMALATVSGLSKSWPATSGEAPSAWKPSMRGAEPACPAPRHSQKPFQYDVMLPAFPTGRASASGGSPRVSATSKAAVFCPSIRSGFTELTRVTSPSSAAILFESFRAASKFPSIWTIRAPCARTCTALPSAILPAGTTTKHSIPARAALAAAEAAVFPVEAQTQAWLPVAAALLMATVIPRSLNEAVGFMPSNFKNSLAPMRSETLRASIRGVSPSPMVAIASSGISGSHSRYLRTTPCRNTRA